MPKQVRLQCAKSDNCSDLEDRTISVDYSLIAQSKTILSTIQALPTEEKFDPIPIDHMTTKTLLKVVEYLEQGRDFKKESTEAADRFTVSKAYFDIDENELYQLIVAANYLGLPALFEACYQQVATLNPEKSMEEVRKIMVGFKPDSHGQNHHSHSHSLRCIVNSNGTSKDDKGMFDNGVSKGQGKFTHSNGKYYKGEWKNGAKNGSGTLFHKDGSVKATGKWKDNHLIHGRVYYPSGEYCEGEWQKGTLTGYATTFFKDGTIRSKGLRKDNKLTGFGEETYEDRAHYRGMFENGLRNGRGHCTFPSGDYVIGEFKNSELHGEATMFFKDGTIDRKGTWKNGEMNGLGEENFENLSHYKGMFENGKRNGRGQYTYPSGDYVIGEWKNGVLHGEATTFFKDGTIKSKGSYKDGKLNGQCRLTKKSGDYIIGEWKNGNWNGEATTFLKDGTIKSKGTYKDGKLNGYGERTYKQGGYYKGMFEMGLRNGQGTFVSPSGDYSVGEWKDEVLNGEATKFFEDGRIRAKGTWKDNKLHGLGERTFKDLSHYTGMFENGRMHGQGKHTAPCGEYIIGTWRTEGKDVFLNGEGTVFFKDGTIKMKGTWKDRKFTGFGETTYENSNHYKGMFENGKMHGQGRHTWPSGGYFIGEFKNDARNGEGTKFTKDGTIIEKGTWKDNQMTGSGERTYQTSGHYKGTFEKGKRHGQGRQTYPSGEYFIGTWSDDKRNGEGTRFYEDGTIKVRGIWKNDELLKD